MKKELGFGFLALALVVSAAPVAQAEEATLEVTAVTAESVSAEDAEVKVEAQSEVRAETRLTPEEKARMEKARMAEQARMERERKMRAEEDGGEADAKVRGQVVAKDVMLLRERLNLSLENDSAMRAATLAELRAKREERRAELMSEEASTTPKFRAVVKNANEVRLAVHTLLASEGLVGGIGPRISEIARRMNDTIGTTTSAEAQIESRGFLKRLFFGGDETAAEAIKKAVGKSEEDIAELKTLLADTTISAEVRAELTAQLATLEKMQERLTTLAEKEGKRWGFFSWRLRGEATATAE